MIPASGQHDAPMNATHRHFVAKGFFTLLALALLPLSHMEGQNGMFFSAQPPIVVRPSTNDFKIYFTNTGDKVLHGITLTSGNDTRSSRVIIDTIQPHATVAIDFIGEIYLNAELTCTNYSKPLPVKP